MGFFFAIHLWQNSQFDRLTFASGSISSSKYKMDQSNEALLSLIFPRVRCLVKKYGSIVNENAQINKKCNPFIHKQKIINNLCSLSY